MKKIIFIISVLLLLICEVASPQFASNQFNFASFKNDFNVVKLIRGESEKYTGTPYLLKEFSDASIRTISGKGYKEIPMNYNIYTDRFEFLFDDQPYSLENTDGITYIDLKGQKFLIKEYDYSSSHVKGYLELLQSGEYSLYKKYRVIYTKPIPTTGYKEAKIADFSSRRPDYFLQFGESEISHITEFKDITGLTPEKSVIIQNYIKKSKLSFKKEEDLVALIDYLNSL